MYPVKSFSEIASLFGEVPFHAPGAWFLLHETELKTARSKQFANKDGVRPVVLAKASGPNAITYPRSASIGGGIKHFAHHHSYSLCAINKTGSVHIDCPITVRSFVLSNETFSCFEPEESLLLAELGKVGAR